MAQPFLSVVIPAYNEAARIGPSLEAIRSFLASKNFTAEVIVVDDGSGDSMPSLIERLNAGWPELRVLRNERNHGKGYSVRRGVMEAQGCYVLFTDADLSTPIEEVDLLLSLLESSHADAAIGSRALRRELIGIRQPWVREFSGRLFNVMVRAMTGLGIHDTQCGFKLFRREIARRAFAIQRSEGFGFDPEVLFLMQRFGGKILEVPVRWNNSPATKVRFLRDSTHMLIDLAALRWRALTGKYDARQNSEITW